MYLNWTSKDIINLIKLNYFLYTFILMILSKPLHYVVNPFIYYIAPLWLQLYENIYLKEMGKTYIYENVWAKTICGKNMGPKYLPNGPP